MKRMVLALLLVVVMIGPLFAGGQEEKKPATLTKLTVISPRGSLEVMDDYLLWVALDMGYFKDQGLDIDMEPGPMDGFACTKFVDQNKADIGYPSPGILTASVDTGMNVIMVYELDDGPGVRFRRAEGQPHPDGKGPGGQDHLRG